MKLVIENLLAKYPGIKLVNIFSDWAQSQFKQNNTLSNLPLWESVLIVKLPWYFFVTSHGKGFVDGLGGSILKDLFNTSIVKIALFPVQVNIQTFTNIDILYIKIFKVEESKPFLEEQFASVGLSFGCRQVHCSKYGN